jgi:mRNA interferase MazF
LGALTAGSVVLVSFPFSDLTRSKRRPALVLASVGKGDFVLCQITSNPYSDAQAIELSDKDFDEGSLSRTSYARPGKLFTAHDSLITEKVGQLSQASQQMVVGAVIALIESKE